MEDWKFRYPGYAEALDMEMKQAMRDAEKNDPTMSELNGWYQEGRPYTMPKHGVIPPDFSGAAEDPEMDELGHEFRYDYGSGLKTSETGGQKAEKPSKLGYIDPNSLFSLGEVAGHGALKYEKFNYLKGYDWSLSFNAMMRHLLQFWAGEDLDAESGLPHTSHAAFHALALTAFIQRGIGKDDRPKGNT
jgi:hypothetical protein